MTDERLSQIKQHFEQRGELYVSETMKVIAEVDLLRDGCASAQAVLELLTKPNQSIGHGDIVQVLDKLAALGCGPGWLKKETP